MGELGTITVAILFFPALLLVLYLVVLLLKKLGLYGHHVSQAGKMTPHYLADFDKDKKVSGDDL